MFPILCSVGTILIDGDLIRSAIACVGCGQKTGWLLRHRVFSTARNRQS